jgi:methyl-accepting chemotaxis protein
MVAHPRAYYIFGVDENGQPVFVPKTREEFTKAQETGIIPLNANYVGFIDPNIPRLAQYNREGRSGSLLYTWRDKQFPQGVERALAYATIPYHGGVYSTPAGFGFVTMTAFASDFHQAATVLGADISREIQQALWIALASVIVIAALIVTAAWLLARNIARPIRDITAVAQQVSQGDYSQDVTTLIGKRSDEFSELAEAFNFMVAKVEAREMKLRQQVQELKIEIDEVKKAHQVAEITETDYFRSLRDRARQLREGKSEMRDERSE